MPPPSQRHSPPDNRLVRVRPLRPDADEVARVQDIFADGMRELSPGVVRAGLLGRRSWRVWAAALLAAALAALYTAHTYQEPAASRRPPPPLAFALARSAIVSSLSFLAVYACYLSTIMDAYVKESLQTDMRDPVAFYLGGGAGGGSVDGSGNNKDNHSCFWVAELIQGPPTPLDARARQQQQQQKKRQEENNAAAASALAPSHRPTLRRRLLVLAGVLAENERATQEEAVAEAREMLEPTRSTAASSIVGCVALEHKPGEARGELRRMSVADEARGRGVAAALASALERHAASRGLKAVFCTTSSLQDPARQLYGAKLGWEEVPVLSDKMAEANGTTFHRYEKRLV